MILALDRIANEIIERVFPTTRVFDDARIHSKNVWK